MTTKAIPDGYDSLIPSLIVRDAAKAIEFYREVFGATESSGAKGVMPPADMFWGDRMGKFIDPFGHQWGVATHIKEVSPEACAKAAAEWAAKQPA